MSAHEFHEFHEAVEMLPLESVLPSPNNPRKSFDEARLAQLEATIRQHGIQVPLTVRPIPAGDGGDAYEIVAGSRRREVARRLKMTHLPCIVRALTEAQAAEIAIIDNLQREEMPPMEEAEAYAALLATLGSAAAIAAQVGKPVEYVTRRLKLRTLTLDCRDALRLQLITLDHALLLAKLGEEEQEKALRYAIRPSATQRDKTSDLLAEASAMLRGEPSKTPGYHWEPVSVQRLKSFIETELKLELKKAPWDLADASLVPAAGACSTCPKNTAANDALFGDLLVKDATCTDAACFNAKREAFVRLHLDAIQQTGGAARVSWKSTAAKPRWAKDGSGPDTSRALKYGQWIDVSGKSCAHAMTGVTVDFDEASRDKTRKPGQVLKVCIAAGCKVHPKAWEKAALAPRNEHGRVDHEARNRERRLRAEAYVASELPIRKAVFDAIVQSKRVGHVDIFRTAIAATLVESDYEVDYADFAKRHGIKVKNSWEAEEAIAKFVGDLPADRLDGFAFELLSEPYLQPQGYLAERVQDDRRQLWALAKKCSVDADAIAKRLSSPGSNPEPAKEVAEKQHLPERTGGAKKKAPSAAASKAKAGGKAAAAAVKKAEKDAAAALAKAAARKKAAKR